MRVGIADYEMGNLASVSKAFDRVGAHAFVSGKPDELAGAEVLVLPGVGNFAAGMTNLTMAGLDTFVRAWAEENRPLVGICLGMQLLFDHSEEGGVDGLGVIPGDVVKIGAGVKVPHMGWNEISVGSSEVFEDSDAKHFYFNHSYVCAPHEGITVATATYGEEFAAAVTKGSVIGVQFHPEKSSKDGLALLERLVGAAA